MDGSTTLRVLFGLSLGAASCLVVINGQTPPKPAAFEVTVVRNETPPGPDGTARPVAPSRDGEHSFTSIQEQPGLKPDSQGGPVDVLVIDSAQRATED